LQHIDDRDALGAGWSFDNDQGPFTFNQPDLGLDMRIAFVSARRRLGSPSRHMQTMVSVVNEPLNRDPNLLRVLVEPERRAGRRPAVYS